MSDGGLGCKRLCDMSGEPLVEGMLVGTSEDLLSTEETHQVSFKRFFSFLFELRH
jgi:amidase